MKLEALIETSALHCLLCLVVVYCCVQLSLLILGIDLLHCRNIDSDNFETPTDEAFEACY